VSFREGLSWVIRSWEVFLHLHLLAGFAVYILVIGLLRKHLRHAKYRAGSRLRIPFEKLHPPPVTVLIPAFNEGREVFLSVDSVMNSRYPRVEIILLDDGSTDSMIEAVRERYALEPQEIRQEPGLSTTRIISAWKSKSHPRLRVISKEHSGKADTLNLGIDLATSEILVCIDGDSIAVPESIEKVVAKFLDEPNLVALGGSLTPYHAVEQTQGELRIRRREEPLLVGIQIIEYLRSFTSWRTGWSYLDGLLVVGGAFTGFSRKALRDVGGFRKESICEDLEMILTLHQYYGERGIPYHIWNIQDVLCWTRAPDTIERLRRQRIRWMYGALQSLSWHRKMLFNRKHGLLGWLSFPHLVFIEVFAPPIELVGLITFVLAAVTGLLSIYSVFAFGLLVYALTGFYSWYALAINDAYVLGFPSLKQILRLGWIGLLEPAGYRQRDAYWRLIAWWRFIRGKHVRWK
jgi:cellulose synthase/poly-beta-1,6-N-acetylglucosamine synthase-like glycosyltransferase